MSAFEVGPIDHARLIESWTWYGVAACVFLFRMASRYLAWRGTGRMPFEEWWAIFTFALYTNFLVWVNIQSKHPQTNILIGRTVAELSPDEIQHRQLGSICTFIVEQNMCFLQWACKFCLLLMFHRVLLGTTTAVIVKIIMVYSMIGFVVFEIFFFGVWCHPFKNYFAVIDNNTEGCTTSQKHLIMSYVFNITSDFLILLIPSKMFYRSNMPLRKKLFLWPIMSLGVVVCVCATMSRVYCFLHPDSILWIYWYVREASTAVIVVNVPNCFQLIKKATKIRGWSYVRASYAAVSSFGRRATSRLAPSRARSGVGGSRTAMAAPGSATTGTKTHGSRYHVPASPTTPLDDIELKTLPTAHVRRLDGDADSTRAVIDGAAGAPVSATRRSTNATSDSELPAYTTTPNPPLEIAVNTEVQVHAEDAASAASGADPDWDPRYGRPPAFDVRGGAAREVPRSMTTTRAFATARLREEKGGSHNAV